MAKIVVNIQVRKAIWLNPILKIIKFLIRNRIISIITARILVANVTNHAIKYRVDKGHWRKFESPKIPFLREF